MPREMANKEDLAKMSKDMASKKDVEVMNGVIMNEMRHIFPHNSTHQEEDKEKNINFFLSQIEKIEK